MKLVTFTDASGPRVGVLDAAETSVVDLGIAAPNLPGSMQALVELGAPALTEIRHARGNGRGLIALSGVRLLAPFPRPLRNVLCVGKNYHEHAAEFHQSGFDSSAGKDAVPEFPIIFTKAPTSVIAPGDPIPAFLDPTQSVDYEGELAVVIGRRGRTIRPEDALAHVYGYTIVNDVTSRTMQQRHRQWFLGKSIDGFCPMGPVLVTADELPDPTVLELETFVNDERRQSASVRDLIFDIPTLIATISLAMTLETGDIIATGTPAGVGIGFTPPKFLTDGDRVRIAIDGIGILENTVAGTAVL